MMLLLLGAAILASVTEVTRAADATVDGVRVGNHAQSTRFVMDLDKKIDFHVFSLADPYRIVVDLPSVPRYFSRLTVSWRRRIR